MPQKLSQEIITAAIAGFEAQKLRINSTIAELRNMLDHRHAAAEAPKPNAQDFGRVPSADGASSEEEMGGDQGTIRGTKGMSLVTACERAGEVSQGAQPCWNLRSAIASEPWRV